jgi:DNA-binding YbaB/EbfC family protein
MFDMNALGGMMAGLQKIQEAAAEARIEGQAGGGLVKVVANGRQDVLSVKIDESVMDDREMLEDLVTAAVADALRRSKEQMADQMKALTGGLPLPPGLF